MLNWTIEKKIFGLKYNWKLSRNESIEKTNFFVHVTDGTYKGVGEIAPNTRYGESVDTVIHNFNDYLKEPLKIIENISEINAVLSERKFTNSVKFGIESAAIHFLSDKKKTSTTSLLKLNPVKDKVDTCYTLPVMGCEKIQDFILSNNLQRFSSLKVKINQETGEDTIHEVIKHTLKPLKIDANEAWKDPDAFINFMEKIRNYNIEFIEQPFPSSYIEEYKFVKSVSPINLFADESIQNQINYVTISQQFHGVNIKLMKAGGYLNAIQMIKNAKSHGLKTMIGCMVESTLGISSAMNLASIVDYADLDGYFILENEPFHMVHEENGKLSLNKK